MTDYDYDAAGRLETVTYENGATANYSYDAAGRVTEIEHAWGGGTRWTVSYGWNLDNTVDYRVEQDNVLGTTATVSFGYDDRKRLASEVRQQDGQAVYSFEFTYDQLGNRKTKINWLAQQKTMYHYDTDLEDPFELEFPTRHNRLLYYQLFDTSGESDVLLRTVRHTYYAIGTVCNISIQDEWIEGVTPGDPNDYDRWHDLGLFYYTNGQLWRAQWSTFKVGPLGKVVPGSHEVDRMREFRYDDPTERYLVADFDSGVADPNTIWPPPTLEWPVRWTDYMGGPAADSEVDYDEGPPKSWTLTTNTEYLPNLHGEIDSASGDATYYHGDLIGSTNLLTHRDGEGGQAAAPATTAYTAFGEAVTLASSPDPNNPNAVIWSASIGGDLPADFPRYGYAGQYGYESGLLSVNGPNTNLPPITLQHLGWRWYDPSIGRFVQRDPIGIFGGVNAYAYVANFPLARVDLRGTLPPEDWSTDNMLRPYQHVPLDNAIPMICIGLGAASSGISPGVEGPVLVIVTRWGAPGLTAGNWVMRGGPTWLNYDLSGKWQPGLGNLLAPFSSYQVYCVRAADLRLPNLLNPINWIKALIGQRICDP